MAQYRYCCHRQAGVSASLHDFSHSTLTMAETRGRTLELAEPD